MIQEENDLDDASIKPGQHIRVPVWSLKSLYGHTAQQSLDSNQDSDRIK